MLDNNKPSASKSRSVGLIDFSEELMLILVA